MKDVLLEDRPYEKLEHFGAEYLSDSDLLAIIIKSGTKKYGLMMLFCLPILAGINFLLEDLATGWVIFIDVVLALFIIIVLDLIVTKIQTNKVLKQKQLEEEQKVLEKVNKKTEQSQEVVVNNNKKRKKKK